MKVRNYTPTDAQVRLISRNLNTVLRMIDSGDSPVDPEQLLQVTGMLARVLNGAQIGLGCLLHAHQELRRPIFQIPEFKIMPIKEQIVMWRRLIPELAGCPDPLTAYNPSFASSIQSGVIIPNWECVGRQSYIGAVDRMHQILHTEHKIAVSVDNGICLIREHIRQRGELVSANNRLCAQTLGLRKYDIQFGTKFFCKSPNRVWDLLEESECGFGPYEMAALFVVHPELALQEPGFRFMCAGAEARQDHAGPFHQSLYYVPEPRRREIKLITAGPSLPVERSVAPTAFYLP